MDEHLATSDRGFRLNAVSKIVLIIALLLGANIGFLASQASDGCPECSWIPHWDVEEHPDGTAAKSCCFSTCAYYPWCLEAFVFGRDYSISVSQKNMDFSTLAGASVAVVDGLAMVCVEGSLDVTLAIGGQDGSDGSWSSPDCCSW